MPGHARMRRSEDFRRTVRHGVRAGRRTVVVHALPADIDAVNQQTGKAQDSLVGFVVGKSVGTAVHRNRVRRRLRHLARPQLTALQQPTLVVVRALPPAATADADLAADLTAAWTAAMAKLAGRTEAGSR